MRAHELLEVLVPVGHYLLDGCHVCRIVPDTLLDHALQILQQSIFLEELAERIDGVHYLDALRPFVYESLLGHHIRVSGEQFATHLLERGLVVDIAVRAVGLLVNESVGIVEHGIVVGIQRLEPLHIGQLAAVQRIGHSTGEKLLLTHVDTVRIHAIDVREERTVRLHGNTVGEGAVAMLPTDERTGGPFALYSTAREGVAARCRDGTVVLVRAAHETSGGVAARKASGKEAVLQSAHELAAEAASVARRGRHVGTAVALGERAGHIHLGPSHDGTCGAGHVGHRRDGTTLDGDTCELCAIDHTEEHGVEVVDGIQLAVEAALERQCRIADGSVAVPCEIYFARQTPLGICVATVDIGGIPFEGRSRVDLVPSVH